MAGTACLKPIIGTGVAVDDDLVLTVAHTIAGAEDDLRIVTPQGEERSVTVVAFDSDRDLALLAVEGLDATPVVLGSAGKGDSGTIAAVNGDLAVEFIKYTVLRVVNARSTDIYNEGHVERDALDIKARIEPGVSGAPLVDSNGEVVGIVFARSETREEGGYALSTSEITDFLDSVDPGTVADRGRCR
ncbi:MAG: serine protease [Actinobacteria bacterium]|nr:serine protease [Actinomycetota bacterium]